MDTIADLSCSRNTDPDMTLGPYSALTWTLTWPWWQHRPPKAIWSQMTVQTLGITQPLVVPGAMDSSSDPVYCLAMNPDTVQGSSRGPDDNMTPCGSAGHPDQHDLTSSMALRHLHSHRICPRPWASVGYGNICACLC